jgi:hypothetical protein
MKKTLQTSFRALFLSVLVGMACTVQGQGLNFNITGQSNTICTVGTNLNSSSHVYLYCTITSTVPGASYYTFTLSSGMSLFVIQQNANTFTLGTWASSAGTHTVYGLAYASNSSSVLLGSAMQTVAALPGPSVSVSGAMQVCPNSVNTYTASGASTYSWTSPNNPTQGGSVATLTAGISSANFSVWAQASNGCANITPVNPSVGTATVTNSSPTICLGGTSTLSAAGASSYTWQPGGFSGPVFVVSPSVTTVYTLTADNGNCVATSTHVVAVAMPPVISVSGPPTVCAGTPAQLTATGANSYAWSNSMGGASIFVSPTSSTCYTVTGSNSGCSATATICLSVIASPTITASGSGAVCLGSSITFSAFGGTSYTWTPGTSTGATLNVIPMGSTSYTVTGAHTTNSCTSSAVVSVTVNAGCAIVWPGDANRDGTVSNADVLELGLQANSTGPARSFTSNAWTGYQASAWSGTLSNGWNKVHADCNGDGVVNASDATAVSLNFSQTHAFRVSASAGNDISIVPQQPSANAGEWSVADVMLGDVNNTLAQVYGVAFELNYDNTMIAADSVYIVYTSSFLKSSNQTIDFGKSVFASGKLFAATVRTDQSNVSGQGKIGELRYKIRADAPDNASISFSATDAIMISSNAVTTPLSEASPVSQTIVNNPSGLIMQTKNSGLRCFPNPANDRLRLESSGGHIAYSIVDITGRAVLTGEFEENTVVDISGLRNGAYVLKARSLAGESVTRLVILR